MEQLPDLMFNARSPGVLHVFYVIRVKRVVLGVNLTWAPQLCTGAAFLFKILPRLGRGGEERHQQVPHQGNSQKSSG